MSLIKSNYIYLIFRKGPNLIIWLKCKNDHVEFFGSKLPIEIHNWGKNNGQHSKLFIFFMYLFMPIHLSLKYVTDLCIYLSLCDDDATEDDEWKNKKINYDDHFCHSFEIQWAVVLQKIYIVIFALSWQLRGHFFTLALFLLVIGV